MKKSIVSIDNIKVASPCPANWSEMKGDARTRFCSQCNLNVYNLSAMTRSEATAFVAQAEGRVCVKFYQRKDGTIITNDCPVGLKLIRQRLARIISTVLAAVMSLMIFTEGVFAGKNVSKRKARRHLVQTREKNRIRVRPTIGVMVYRSQPIIMPSLPQSDSPSAKQEVDQSPPPPKK